MRFVLVLIAMLAASPALAQYWTHYANARFAYEIDIPPGFEGNGESANGDGQGFQNLQAAQGLVVWGGQVLEDFSTEVTQAQAAALADGWMQGGQTVTPQWAYFTAFKGQRGLYQRMILLCDGTSYAAFRLEHSVADTAEIEAVIGGLVRSFAAEGC